MRRGIGTVFISERHVSRQLAHAQVRCATPPGGGPIDGFS